MTWTMLLDVSTSFVTRGKLHFNSVELMQIQQSTKRLISCRTNNDDGDDDDSGC